MGMNDPRAIIAGILAAIALVGAITLAGMQRDATQITALFGLASTFGAYAVGLYSEPQDPQA